MSGCPSQGAFFQVYRINSRAFLISILWYFECRLTSTTCIDQSLVRLLARAMLPPNVASDSEFVIFWKKSLPSYNPDTQGLARS